MTSLQSKSFEHSQQWLEPVYRKLLNEKLRASPSIKRIHTSHKKMPLRSERLSIKWTETTSTGTEFEGAQSSETLLPLKSYSAIDVVDSSIEAAVDSGYIDTADSRGPAKYYLFEWTESKEFLRRHRKHCDSYFRCGSLSFTCRELAICLQYIVNSRSSKRTNYYEILQVFKRRGWREDSEIAGPLRQTPNRNQCQRVLKKISRSSVCIWKLPEQVPKRWGEDLSQNLPCRDSNREFPSSASPLRRVHSISICTRKPRTSKWFCCICSVDGVQKKIIIDRVDRENLNNQQTGSEFHLYRGPSHTSLSAKINTE